MVNITKCLCSRRHQKHIVLISFLVYVAYILCMKNIIQPICFNDTDFLQLYPLFNLSKVVNDIEQTGVTNTDFLNSIYTFFKIINSPRDFRSTNILLLIMVKSSVHNFALRNAIRKSWGRRNNQIHVLFSLGYDKNVMDTVNEEVRIFNDIVQGSFEDRYRNNTIKSSMIYKWISENSSHLRSVLLVDDDYFVNVEEILKFVTVLVKSGTSGKMFGTLQTCGGPFRFPSVPNVYVTRKEYAYKYYPPYLSGGAILTTLDVVKRISKAIPSLRAFNIDDVYIGLLAHLLNIELVHHSKFTVTTQPKQQLKRYFCVHGFDEVTLLYAWEYIHKDK